MPFRAAIRDASEELMPHFRFQAAAMTPFPTLDLFPPPCSYCVLVVAGGGGLAEARLQDYVRSTLTSLEKTRRLAELATDAVCGATASSVFSLAPAWVGRGVRLQEGSVRRPAGEFVVVIVFVFVFVRVGALLVDVLLESRTCRRRVCLGAATSSFASSCRGGLRARTSLQDERLVPGNHASFRTLVVNLGTLILGALCVHLYRSRWHLLASLCFCLARPARTSSGCCISWSWSAGLASACRRRVFSLPVQHISLDRHGSFVL